MENQKVLVYPYGDLTLVPEVRLKIIFPMIGEGRKVFFKTTGHTIGPSKRGRNGLCMLLKERGVDQFVGFTNSPPIQLTKNGKAYSSNGEEANISVENYLPFSKFLVDVSKQFEKEGIPFNYLSPFNEPQWDWTGNGQEGTPFKNDEIFAITKVLDSLLTAGEIKDKNSDSRSC